MSAQVLYVGEQGDFVGLDQVNVAVPRTLIGRGEVDIVLTEDGRAANTVRLAFAGNQTCSYALSASSQSFPSSGGTSSVNVTAQSGCAWTAASNADFITITSGASGAGNGTVNYSVAANTTNQRTGTLTIAGQTFTVTQTGRPCSYMIPTTSQSFNANANTGSVNVTATSGCAWTATSNADFITITSGASGAGNGTVNFTVAANTTSQRTGTLTIAGQTFTVTQTGRPCSYMIPTTSQSFNANANTGSVNVTATSGCAWMATSNASFITITSGASGTGNGAVNFNVAANTTASQRTGTLTIAGITFTVTQAAATLTVRERRLTGGPIPDACVPPVAKTAFLTTDKRVYQWTLVSGARIGDQVRWEFAPVNGSFVQTQQYTVQFNDNLCFWASLNIAGFPAAALPGNWQVRVFYNNALLFTDNFTISSGGVRVTDHKMTGGPIPDQCVPPPAKNSFAPTDAQAYLWTLVAGAKIGDLVRWEFVQPGGTIYTTSDYTVAFNDNICFWGGINIAGTRAASLPGNWQARLLYNGAPLVTENFTLAAAAVESKQSAPPISSRVIGSSGGSRSP